KCGSVDRARSLFESLPRKSALCWNFVIGAYAGNGRGDESLYLFRRMALEGERPDRHTFVRVLGACTNTAQGTAIHRHISSSELEFDLMLQNSLVAMYGRHGRVDLARSVFQSIPEKSLVSWNAMITAYARNGHSREAAHAYNEMISTGIEPNQISTLTTVLGACSSSRDLKTGKMIHSRAICCGFDKEDQALQVAVVNFYVKCGAVADARRVFDGIAQKSVVVHTAMIGGYAQHGHSREALEIYHAMNNSGLVLETALVKMYTSFDDCASARGVFDRMERRDLMDPDSTTLSTLLGACSLLGDLSSGKIFHELRIERKMMQADAFLCSSLVNMYAKCGSVGTAREVFHAFRAGFGASSVLWNTILAALAHTGDSSQSLELLLEMELEGVTPDSTTFVCALVACNHAGLLQRGKLLFQILVLDHSSRPSLEHFLCMADLLGRAGRVDFAREVVEGEADAVAWKALLGSSRGSIDLEKAAFAAQRLVEMDEELGQAFVLLSNAFS
ncbi:hypothetical protein SELMODRAFT_51593, partial [Selaginella moellendorffii]